MFEFPITFVKEPKEPNERMIDMSIGAKIPYWKNDFMLILLEYYKKYQKEGLSTTTRISEFTREYRMETDLYLSYLNDRTRKFNGKNVHLSSLYDDFKYWYKNNNPQEKIPSNHKFLQGVRKHVNVDRAVRIGKKVSTGVKNLCLIEESLSDEDDIEVI